MGVLTDTFHQTRLLQHSAVGQCKRLHIFFVAGNPGPLHFYVTFLQKIFAGLVSGDFCSSYDTISCHGVGHANHHVEGSPSSSSRSHPSDDAEKYNLEFQICHKLVFISSVLDESRHNEGNCYSKADVMMIGHSIGSYIVLDMLERCEQLRLRTRFINLLMPFIFWSKIPFMHRAKLSSYVALHPMSQHLITSLVSTFLKVGPTKRKRLIAMFSGEEGHQLDTIADGLVNKRILNNFLSMGLDEIRDVKSNECRMLSMLQSLDEDNMNGKKDIFILYTDHDEWAPEADAVMLRTKLKNCTTIVIEPGLTHGFCMTDIRNDRTCTILVNHLNRIKSLSPEDDSADTAYHHRIEGNFMRRISKL